MKQDKPSLDIVGDVVGEPLTRHDQATLTDLVDDYRSRRITRGSFLRSTAVFGLSATSLSGLLAACGGDGKQAAATTTGATQRTSAKLNVGIGQDADTVDPQAFKSIPGYYMLANLYDQLIDLEPTRDGDLLKVGAAPMIDKTMQVSDDRLTATFNLDPNAKFEDGSPITSADVKYTFTRGIKGTQYTSILMGMLTLSKPENIQTPDEQTVIFKLDKPNPMLERLLSLQVLSIQSKAKGEAAATAKDKFSDAYWRSNVFANSAYTLKSWNRGEGFELAPNANYNRKGRPKNGGLVFRIISDPQERLNLLKSGDLHISYDVSAKDAAAIRDEGGNSKLISAPSPWNFALSFNNSQKPFDDVRVRQALSYAVPYDAIINDVMHGLARPSKSIVVPGMDTSDQSFWKYDTNMQKAKEMLTAAGHPDGFNSSIDVLIGRAEDEQAATFIQSSFREIGVNVEIRKLAEAQYQANRNDAKSPMQMIEFFSWVNDPMYHMFWNMLSTNAFTNSSRYNNKTVDKLILDGLYEPDLAKRESLSKQAQKTIVEEAPWAFLYARDYYVPVAKNLTDYPLWPDQNPRLYWSYLSA